MNPVDAPYPEKTPRPAFISIKAVSIHFYHDADRTTPGDDTDTTSGIETAMLFFYAGHGGPTAWDTLGNSATQGNMSLGDFKEGGLSRYYWQCSCKVFAHGPKDCPGATWDYACPGDFDGSADSENMRNVYERWGPVLEPDVRMACGSSTPAYCHEWVTDKIWDNYNNHGFDVADAFIDGLNWYGVVPLCITLGGADVDDTPLVTDATFTNEPNTSGTSHYHIQYLSNFASTPRLILVPLPVPELLPILQIRPLPLPDPLQGVEFKTQEHLMLSSDEVGERGPRVQVNRLSGAVYVRGARQSSLEDAILGEEEYVARALDFIEEQGWSERDLTDPVGVRIIIATTPVDGSQSEQQTSQKNVIVTLRRQIDVGGVKISVLGPGGVMQVQMNNDGSILNASKVWREVASTNDQGQARVKSYEEAYQEALEQIEDPEAYKLDEWNWGYKEAAGNVEQTELRVVFQFTFLPADPETTLAYPPRMIEVAGHVE